MSTASTQPSHRPERRRFPFLGAGAVADRGFWLICLLAASSIIVVAALLVVFLLIESWPAILAFGPHFLISPDWDPRHENYGALPFIWGTVATSAIAMLLGVPLGVGSAAFLAEIAPSWMRRTGSFLLELLAAIPSVVYGFWGYFFLAPIVQIFFNNIAAFSQLFFDAPKAPSGGGNGIFSAGLILVIMVVPYITAITFEVCRAVPRSQREASFALGATRWQTIWNVVLPYARPGIIGACFLALGRALGETMAVTMLIGNRAVIDFSIYAHGNSIASVIATNLGNTDKPLQTSALVELGLVLLLVTVVVNCLARIMIWQMGRPVGWRFSLLRPAPITISAGTPRSLPARRRAGPIFPKLMNAFMTGALGLCLVIIIVPLFFILGYITFRGAEGLNWAFFTHLPNDEPEPGLGNALVGSLLLVSLATLFAVPFGILAGVYLAEYRQSRLAPVVRFIGELLGGVPSIIIGILGYALFVRYGHFSAWAGAFALGVMMIPIVMRASEEALRLVPQSLRNGSYALGASTWQTIVRVVVPAALPTIITGVLLAVARIAGETAPLLLTAYSSLFWPTSLNDRMPFLTYYIYTYSRNNDASEEQLAWTGALVLVTAIMLLNIAVRVLTGRRAALASQTD